MFLQKATKHTKTHANGLNLKKTKNRTLIIDSTENRVLLALPPMAQPSSAPDSDPASSHRNVYVSTNLDTHLGLSVSVSDTIADLKKKILVEHPVNFPKLGEIEIHALKIKRKGIFYHMADSAYIKNSFDGVMKGNWYFYLDASTLLEHSEKLHPDPTSDNTLACRREINNSSDDVVHVLGDGGSGWLANSSGLPLLQIEYNLGANEEPPITERFCSGASSRDSSKDPMTKGKHVSDNHCKYDARGEGLEVREKQTECMVDNSRDEIIDKKNKHKKKKDVVCDLVEEENVAFTGVPPKDTSQHDVGVADNTGVQKINDQSKVIGVSLQEADSNIDKSENGAVVVNCNNLWGVISEHGSPAKKKHKRLASEVQKTNDLSEGIEVPVRHDNMNDKSENGVVDIPCNNLLGDISSPVHISTAKKKSHAKKNKSNKDAYKDTTTPEYSLGENTGKRKRKPSDRRKAADADLSSVKELREENSQGILEDNHKDSGETEAVVTGEIVPDEIITKVDSASLKEKYDDPVEQVVERNVPWSLDVDTEDPSACDVGGVSGVEKMDASRSCNVDLKDMPSSTAQELKDLESNTEVGVQENTIAEYIKRTGVDQSDVIEEAIELYQIDNTVDKTPEPAKSSKKANKSKKDKKADKKRSHIDAAGSALEVQVEDQDAGLKIPVVSSDVAMNDISKIKTDVISRMATEEETKKRTEDELSLLQEIRKGQTGDGNVDGKKKRINKKRQPDVEIRALEFQEKDQGTGLKIPVGSSDMKRNDVSNLETNGICVVATEEEVPSLQEIRKGPAGGENVGRKKKKTTKKMQTDLAINTTEVQGKDQDAGLEIPVVSNDMERNDVSKISTDGNSVVDTEEETEKRIEEKVLSLQEIRRSAAVGENVGRKKKKATKKMQTDLAINNIEVQEKDQDVGLEIPVVSNDMGRNDVSKTNTDGNCVVVTEEETDKRIEEKVLSLQEIRRSPAVGENVGRKKKKMTKKMQTDLAINNIEVQEKDQDAGLEIPVVSNDMERNDVSKTNTDGNSVVATEEKMEKRIEEKVLPLQEISKSQAVDENMDGKKKRATKKRQTDAARSALKVQEKDQSSGFKNPAVSSNTAMNDVSKIKTDGIFSISAEEKVPSFQEISKSQAGGENVDGKKKKTSKKRQTDVARSALEVQEKDQDAGLKIPVLSSDTNVAGASSKREKKAKLAKSSSLEKSIHVKNSGELVSGTVDCSQVPSHVVQGNDEVQVLEAVDNANSHNSGYVEEDNSQKEVSNESNGIDGQDEQGVKSDDKAVDNKVIRKNTSDRETETKSNMGKLVVHSTSESPNLQSSVKVIQSRGSKRKSQDGNSSAVELPASSLKKSSKMALKASECKMTPAPSINSSKLNSVSEQPRNPDIIMASGFSTPMGKRKGVFTKPDSSLQSSKARNDLQSRSVRKSSGSNLGEVVNKTEKKSLLATSSAIFKDDSSRSSSLGDRAGVDSDASTRTPSNNLSSSDFSDAESNASQNEADSSERTEDGKKLSSVPKSMKLAEILRNSSSYKKLKLSQPEDDSESQPIDFVPDSEANP